jgi:hypothetical protein
MPKQLHLTCLIDLPADVFEAAKIIDQTAVPWQTLLADLKRTQVVHTHTSETIETRAKPAGNGTRAPRRTKAQIAADKAAHGAAGTELGV